MEYFELTPREAAYNLFGALNTRIDQIRRYDRTLNLDDKVDLDEITKKVFHLDPAITLPLVTSIIDSIEEVLLSKENILTKVEDRIKELTKKVPSAKPKGSKKKNPAIEITDKLIEELGIYKSSLSEIQERLEQLNIESTTQPGLRLKWGISLKLLADLFKVLREHQAILEEKEGELTTFISSNFSVPRSPKISKGSLSSLMSGNLNDHAEFKEFLKKLIITASQVGGK